MFSDSEINSQDFALLRELIVNHLVCVMTNQRRAVGSGILVTRGGRNFVVTANHVVSDARDGEVELFSRLPGTLREPGSTPPQPGRKIEQPILRRIRGGHDLAAFEFEPFTPPNPAGWYDLDAVAPAGLEKGTSLVYCGFPTSVATAAAPNLRGVPVTDDHTWYEPDLWRKSSRRIRLSDFDCDAQILVPYKRQLEGVDPHGFSGAGVWARRNSQVSTLVQPRPVLVGAIVGYFTAVRALNVTCAAEIASMIDAG